MAEIPSIRISNRAAYIALAAKLEVIVCRYDAPADYIYLLSAERPDMPKTDKCVFLSVLNPCVQRMCIVVNTYSIVMSWIIWVFKVINISYVIPNCMRCPSDCYARLPSWGKVNNFGFPPLAIDISIRRQRSNDQSYLQRLELGY